MSTQLVVRAKPKVEIGLRYKSQRTVLYDSRDGIYEEMNPVLDNYARLLQLALTNDLLTQARVRVQQKIKALRPSKPSRKGD